MICCIFLLEFDDIDKLLIRGLEFGRLRNVCGGFVDLASAPCRSRDAVDMGVCIISSPAYVFIPNDKKGAFIAGLSHFCPDRFLPISARPDCLLATCQPRKIHVSDVIEALLRSGVLHVNLLVYGCKSAWPLLMWLDDIGQADVVVDIGHMLSMQPPGIHLVRKCRGVDVGGFVVSSWPMLTSMQRDVGGQFFGSLQLQSPDPSLPINGVIALKVYPTLTHVVKGLATANFSVLPDTVQVARRRRTQAADLLRTMRVNDYASAVSKVRVEVTLKLDSSLSDGVEKARQVGRDVTGALEWRTFGYNDYLIEIDRMCAVAGQLRFGIGPNTARLSALHQEFAGHLINATGLCTVRVKQTLRVCDVAGRFRWEAIEPRVDVVDDSADEFQSVQPPPVAAPTVPVVALPPAVVPVTLGLGTRERQVMTVPTVETELGYIRAHVGVFNAPRGKRSVRRRNGSILKADQDEEVLFRYVLQHVPDWRDTLSVW